MCAVKDDHNAETVRHGIVEGWVGLGQRHTIRCLCGWHGSGQTKVEALDTYAAHFEDQPEWERRLTSGELGVDERACSLCGDVLPVDQLRVSVSEEIVYWRCADCRGDS